MHEITTEIDIQAGPDQVWSILMDFPKYPEWNPFVRSIGGQAAAGARLTVTIQPQGGREMTFRPRVLVMIPNRELRWLGRVLVPGLFDGEHFFRLESVARDLTRFSHGELFSGILVPFFKAKLEAGTRAGFPAMNEALKLRAEEKPRPETVIQPPGSHYPPRP